MQSVKEYSWTLEAHAVFKWILLVQFVIALGIGLATNSVMTALFIGIPIVVIPIYLGMNMPHHPVSRHTVGIATQLMAALHIQQTYGMTELHFEVFVMLAFLFFFRDWRVVVSSTLVVALHHIGFFGLQYFNVEGFYAFEEGRVIFYVLVIHALFAIAEALVLGYMAHKSHHEAIGADLLRASVVKIMREDGLIDLNESNLQDAETLADFNKLIRSMQSLIREVNEAGDSLLGVVDKVARSSDSLDNSVDTQNKQVSQISDSMQNITQSIQHVAELSKNANDVAGDAKASTDSTRETLAQSGASVGQLKGTLQTTSTAIADLSAKCTNIADVMQSIKAVAEQTNLLALNAAIESARAGEHGRGFAVVADEVRNLAIKSKESAEEIEQITSQLTESANNSVENMNSCVEMVENAVTSSAQASENMVSVLSNIDIVNQNVTNVASSASEQASTSEQISDSAQSLYAMFAEEKQQVDSLKSEVNELNGLAEQLRKQLARFAV
ncbi:methyl-accepting chemotaxis protein [Glaciecola sp. KUL10]|uniref:methyl-accepting chemotaxis protein n=1 Tax=Glaciecola sp. (strain KUL10) TaxID=2161813 RepID=UPI000D782424|nr:methyl-accepting chemotaxis protein [Glaciecola sp. KUL10]GBL03773.1 methyl-accepting chemotaxis protein [Glaciecola sp. KUL10]